MITSSKIACPVCDGEHPSGPRLVGLTVIGCDKLEPVGETRIFPMDSVIVVGAGLGVTEARPKPVVETPRTESVGELQAELDRLNEADRVKELKAQIEAKKAAAASSEPPAPVVPAEPVKVQA